MELWIYIQGAAVYMEHYIHFFYGALHMLSPVFVDGVLHLHVNSFCTLSLPYSLDNQWWARPCPTRK